MVSKFTINTNSILDDNFIEELLKIINQLNYDVIEISGCPGTGKTTLLNKLLKKNSDFFNYEIFRNENSLFLNNVKIIFHYLMSLIKNLKFYFLIFKNLKGNKLKILKGFIYWYFTLDYELKMLKINKLIIRDEPIFQIFFNYKFFHDDNIKNLNEIISVLNRIFYSKKKVLNLHLVDNSVGTIINNRKKRNREFTDRGKSINKLELEINTYKENISNYIYSVEYCYFIKINIKT
jgi:hypothetical protein